MSIADDVRPVDSRPGEPRGGERPAGDGQFDRTPPQDVAAEQCALGGMLLSKDAIADVVEILRAPDFYRPNHATIFESILDLYGRGEPADAITVAAALADSGDLARVGGAAYMHTLIASVPTAANAAYYAKIVSERAVLRRLIEAGTRIVQLGYGSVGGAGRDTDDLVDLAQQAVYDVTERRVSEDFAVLAEMLQPTLDEIEAVGAQGGLMTGVPTGFTDLDRLLNGLHPGQLIIVAGRPGLGKCLHGRTLITEAWTGQRMTLDEFVRRGRTGERLGIHTLTDEWKLDVVTPSDFLHNGRQPVSRLLTRSGRSILATANHPFRTLAGWRPLSSLRPGDHIAVPRRLLHEWATTRFSDELVAERERRGRHSNTDLLPRDVWALVLAEKGGLTWAEISKRCGRPRNHNWHVGKQGIGRARLAELAKALDSTRLRDLAESDVLWDPVVSVEPAGDGDVYDLTIDGTHNFVANDMVVHNSTAAMDFSRTAAVKHNMASAIFSLEMSKVEIVMRLLSAEARVPLHVLRSGQLSDDDWTKLARRMGEISEAPLFVDDTPSMNLMEIRAKARRLKQRHDLKLIIVDYLQLMTSPKRTESRQQEVADLSRGLKLLAKEVECPVVAVSQLNRGPEQRTDKRPQLSDLRESGCLTAATRVIRADTNTEVTLGSLLLEGARDIPVWALDERLKYTSRTMTHVFPSGRKPVFRLQLASGKEIEATANHPFLTFDGWRPLGDIPVGARVAVPRHIPAPERETSWSNEQVVMLAHLLGDGSFVRRQPIRNASRDEACLAAVSSSAAYFGITPARDDHEAAWVTTLRLPAPYRLARGRRNPIAKWLDGMGLFGLRSHEKFVPSGVFSLPKEQIALFLRHLWATDGSVTLNARGSGGRIYYGSTSRRLLDDAALLLLRFGISTRIRTVRPEGHRPQFTLDISGKDDQLRFLREVGVYGARADACVRLASALEGVRSNPNVDTIPKEVWTRVRAILLERGMIHREFAAAMGTQFCGSAQWRCAPSRQRLARIASLLDAADLDLMATNDVLWDEVLHVQALGEQDVYDATVLGAHNFVANGIAVHNSIEQDADVVILLHRDDYYDKESPRAGEADFIVAKHRNGPTDTVTVAAQLHLSRFVDMAI